ncbi:RNA recognition motif domain [Macleaya cordata]|uniref:RNA recognition motif domain n=1 Tax=Macleaya cordata TaxID=56857 RepID=A0A200PM61_MACCD|nr:RNA recognition motif domain [Macleaya cordata]
MAQESLVETLEPSSGNQPIDQISDRSPAESIPSDVSSSRNGSSRRLNARAPEFVPRTSNRTDLQPPRLVIQQIPAPIHIFPSPNSQFHAPYQNYGGFGEHDMVHAQVPVDPDPVPVTRNGLSEEVEYYFSDANLATTDHLIRFINKDPEGFVPISVVASFKKIKALISSHSQLAAVLQKSSKLVVSDDGKKVKRQIPLTELDMEDLQSRIVVAENLPDDHSHQNLMRVFSAVGSVKTIRTCQPQPSNGGASAASRLTKVENMLYSNKLHAFVEYETVELAEKAVAELNDERNWRSGLRVRLLLKRTSKSAQPRGRKAGHEGEANGEEDDMSTSEHANEKHSDDPSQSSATTLHEHVGEEGANNDKEGGPRKGRARGRGKGRGRGQFNNSRNNHHIGTPPSTNSIQNEQTTVMKQPPGPRMPDGTKGFAMGRGKPVVTSSV